MLGLIVGVPWRVWLALLLLAGAPTLAQSGTTVRGTVVDPSGAVIVGAEVSADCAAKTLRTDNLGQFAITCDDIPHRLRVAAPGFAPTNAQVSDPAEPIRIVLNLRSTWDVYVPGEDVSAKLVNEVGQTVQTISEEQLLASPQPTVDDALRNVAGFALFRRSGSRVANPTSQGVSLRGLGASGASRALVLYDQVPLNDPFGGWVYWSRVDPEVATSIDVFQGGGSDFYGDQALAGVIKIARRSPETSLRVTSEGGSLGSFEEAASGGWAIGPIHASGFFNLGATNGYVLVPSNIRGVVDSPANARHSSGELRLEGTWKQALFFVQGNGFGERRHNGTPLQNNDTQLFALSAGVDRETGGGSLVLRVDGSGQSYNQSFSSIAPDRNSEMPARLQHVPAQQFGMRAVWGRALGAHLISLGGDLRQIRGVTQETIFIAGLPSSIVDAGGQQLFGGAFVQDGWKITSRLTVGATLRLDGWNNYEAASVTQSVTGTDLGTRTGFRDRSEFAVDPRLSMVYRTTSNVSLFATGYTSFRAPRLNELYRAFRLGNVLTLANADLKAERLTGVDAGAGFDADHFHGRATFFFARVTDSIANVTLNVTPALITRQRQNAGALESRGVQLTTSMNLHRDWTLRGDYQFADSTITRFEPNPLLVGKRVPQVPRHSFTTSLAFHRARWSAVLNGRVTTQQFEDDLNLFDLGGASSFDVYGSRKWNDHFETFVAAENLLDQRDLIALTPTPNLSLPFAARAGIRITIGRERTPID